MRARGVSPKSTNVRGLVEIVKKKKTKRVDFLYPSYSLDSDNNNNNSNKLVEMYSFNHGAGRGRAETIAVSTRLVVLFYCRSKKSPLDWIRWPPSQTVGRQTVPGKPKRTITKTISDDYLLIFYFFILPRDDRVFYWFAIDLKSYGQLGIAGARGVIGFFPFFTYFRNATLIFAVAQPSTILEKPNTSPSKLPRG